MPLADNGKAGQTRRKPLVVLLGPTAVGKTELSLLLCEKFGGEVVGADSRQIYRGMDIGTAKPSPDELSRVPHHLVDICNPDETLTVAEYQSLAYQTIDRIHARHCVPFLVGGTALYIRAVVEGLRIPEVPPDPAVRSELEAYLSAHGRDALYERLSTVDPATAAVVDGKNPRRVLRALEIFLITGRSKIELEGKAPPPYEQLILGLDRPRAEIYDRIDRRVDDMIREGLIAETARLLDAGTDLTLPAMTGLGYRQIAAYLHGECTLEEAVQYIKYETHRFVRHQYTSFRRMDDVVWFDMQDPASARSVERTIGEFLSPAKPEDGSG